MLSSLLLLATATLSHAFYYTNDGGETRAVVSSRLFGRNKGWGDIDAKDVCKIKAAPDNIKLQVLNTTNLAHCEARLFQWANLPDNSIQNTGDSPGLQVTYEDVGCQVCNFGTKQHVDPANLKLLFSRISCGSQDAPIMGFGYSDNKDDSFYYVSYAPAGHLQPCYAHKKKGGAEGLENAD